jgi:hypothetical protein
MRRRDWADDEAEGLYEMVREGEDDEEVIEAIALALRKAAGVETPRTLTREEYEAVSKPTPGVDGKAK